MAVLFTHIGVGLSFTFEDMTPDSITRKWYIDGTELADTSKKLTHVFPEANVYSVKLEVNLESLTKQVVAYAEGMGITTTIEEQVKGESTTEFPDNVITDMVRRWQLHLADAVGLTGADVFNQAKWPSLYNAMIAKLVVREQMVSSLKQTVQNTSAGRGGLKSIETGPSKAEWYEVKDSTGSMVKDMNVNQQVDDEICEMASKLGVRLLMCAKRRDTKVFEVVKRKCRR